MPTIGHAQPGSRIDTSSADRPDLILGMTELTKLHIYVATDERALYVTPAGEGP
jgi:hypothetical protein